MKANIIKENVTASRRKEIWELGRTQKFEEPTIYIVKPTEPSLSIHGADALAKHIDQSKVPVGMPIIRIDSSKSSGVVYTDSSVILVRIFAPLMEVIKARKEFPSIAINTLAKKGIIAKISMHRPHANDLAIEVDGREKKFSGSYTDLDQSYFSFFITLNFNADAVKDVYILNTDKFASRGEVTGIADVVTGLRDVYPFADESLVDEIVADLANALGWSTQ